MAGIQILNKEILAERKYRLEYITYQKFDMEGRAHDMAAEVYFRPDAAAVLLYDDAQEMLVLARQFRMPVYLNTSDTGHITEACAGLIDEGETPEQAIIREVQEELGYHIDDPRPAGRVYTSGGATTELIYLFTAPCSASDKKYKGGGKPGEGEDITAVHMSYTEAREALRQGKIIDAKTLMLLQHFFLFIHPAVN